MLSMSLVRRYLDAIAHLDWDTARECLSEDVVRVGPFGDTYQGRDEYLRFLQRLMPTLKSYQMDLDRVITGADGRCAVAELTETMEIDGRTVVTPESLVFDLDQDDHILGIKIYIQRT
jgi:ketosteroid isomerase-like protein